MTAYRGNGLRPGDRKCNMKHGAFIRRIRSASRDVRRFLVKGLPYAICFILIMISTLPQRALTAPTAFYSDLISMSNLASESLLKDLSYNHNFQHLHLLL